ncbi:Emopamil-binding protein, partial [Patellaria atrata CBS 101060]
PSSGPKIDQTTILSLLAVLAVLLIALLVSKLSLPTPSSKKTRFLFIWHLFDALIHLIFEGSFLWNCFFVSVPLHIHAKTPSGVIPPTDPHRISFTPADVFFLNDRESVYGAAYGTGVLSRLWQEYALADRRWGGVDLGVVSLELLTVFVGAPLAAYVCVLLARGEGEEGMVRGKGDMGLKRVFGGRVAFWMAVLATGELYGGFMTFCPEWLSGSPNLDTSNWMFLWVYLFFFNTLWVWIPLWILYEVYGSVTA